MKNLTASKLFQCKSCSNIKKRKYYGKLGICTVCLKKKLAALAAIPTTAEAQ